jgi:hypothetical protein
MATAVRSSPDGDISANVDALRAQLRYIYDSYRTAALNRKYYGEKLSRYRNRNFYLEIAIAVGATGSTGVAGLAIWNTAIGAPIWVVVSSIAVVLSVIKPVLQLGKEIENYTKLYTGHTSIFLELKAVVEEIDITKVISKTIEDRYTAIRQLARELGGLEDPKPDLALIEKLQTLVNREIIADDLWFP